ncbi:serine protease gd-like [Cydia strobilella]|uniref:serine protease gd-like n=1 Tax=Cydia strobilella TaxID=1100964 RepID=UPI0030071FB3
MCRFLYSVLIVLACKSYLPVISQYVDSPCPETFEYQRDGNGVYGVIHLKPNGPASSVVVNFTIAARLVSNYPGRLQPIKTSGLQFNQDSSIDYRVDFPVTTPLPKLTYLIVNGRVLCHGPGDVARPDLYVTTISLRHMLNIRVRGGRPENPGSIKLISSSPDVDVFEINVDGDRTGTWNDGNQRTQRPAPPSPPPQDEYYLLELPQHTTTTRRPQQQPQTQQPASPPPPPDETYLLELPLHTTTTRRPQQQPQTQQPAPPPPPPDETYLLELPLHTTATRRPQQQPQTQQPAPPPPPPDEGYLVELPLHTTATRRPQQQPQTQQPAPPPPPPDEGYLVELPLHTTTTRRPTSTTPPPRPQTTYPSMPSRTRTEDEGSFSSECGLVAGGNEHVPLVFHGTGYTRGDWPWLVAMYKRMEGSLTFACSGTLVSDRHVVSAAHCLQQRSTLTSIRDIVVKVGVHNLEDWGDDIVVTRTLESAIIHEEFNSTTYTNDLLVLTFDKSVEFNNNIRPACLWNGNNDLNRIVGSSGVVAGWGSSELGPGSKGKGEPRMVRIPIVTTSMCRASRPDFHVFTSNHTFCGGDRNGAGPCLGDSGGGLYILDGGRWRLRGVVSLSLRPENGESTCNLNEYVIFTDAAKFIEWIKKVISNKF